MTPEPIESLARYVEIISRKIDGRVFKNVNCALMPARIETLAVSGRLSHIATGAATYILHENGFYKRLYIYAADDAEEKNFPRFCDAVAADFPGVNGKLPDKSVRAIELLKKAGFSLNDTSRRMVKNTIPDIETAEPRVSGVSVRPAKIEHMSQIYGVWGNIFDFAACLIPDEFDLTEQIEAGNVLCAFSGDKIIGVINADIVNENIFIRHLAVDKNHRNMKIGNALRASALALAKERGAKRRFLWVSDHNINATRSYLKRGYEFDGRFTEAYIINDRGKINKNNLRGDI